MTVLVIESNHEVVAIVKDREALEAWASRELSYRTWCSSYHISDDYISFSDGTSYGVIPTQVFE